MHGCYGDVAYSLFSLFSCSILQTVTGLPLTGFAAGQVFAVSIPASPAYVKLPLSALAFDTSSSRGVNYALVLSASAPVNWHSVDSVAPNYLPAAGAASVYGSWSSSDGGGSWTSTLPYRGAWLSAIKTICSPTPTQSQTGSQSQSSTQALTPSGIFTPSQVRTSCFV